MDAKQRLVLIDRKTLDIKGVRSVDSFDNLKIELSTNMGGLEIMGDDLTISNLNLEQEEVTISGHINEIKYGKSREERTAKAKSKNALSRIFR